jgi:hypothetical protein
MKKITIPLMGGLGNQLFQIAAGTYIEKIHGRTVLFSPFLLSSIYSKSNTVRYFESQQLLSQKELDRSRLFSAKLQIHKWLKTGYLLTEEESQGNSLIEIRQRTSLLMGYFQNFQIVELGKSETLNRFNHYEKLLGFDNSIVSDSIALHIRFGDYRTNQKTREFHGLTSINYFTSAVSLLEDQNGFSNIMIFSDEPELASLQFKDVYRGPLPVLTHQSTTSPLNDLILMSKAKAIVMSNSSFSWWAAWLGTQTDAQVIAPVPWFATDSDTENKLLDARWILLRREVT